MSDPTELETLCQAAGLTPLQTRVTVLYRTLEPPQIARQLLEVPEGLGRKHRARRLRRLLLEVREALESASAILGQTYPELFRAGRDFAQQLVLCQANRGVYDERPAGVAGVAPAQEAKGFKVGKLIAGDDRRLRQSPVACLRLWSQEVTVAA